MKIDLVEEQILSIIIDDLKINYLETLQNAESGYRDTKLIYAFERLLKFYMPVQDAKLWIKESK